MPLIQNLQGLNISLSANFGRDWGMPAVILVCSPNLEGWHPFICPISVPLRFKQNLQGHNVSLWAKFRQNWGMPASLASNLAFRLLNKHPHQMALSKFQQRGDVRLGSKCLCSEFRCNRKNFRTGCVVTSTNLQGVYAKILVLFVEILIHSRLASLAARSAAI